MTLAFLGPLHLTHDHLWSLTWGQVDDLLHAWRYTDYLEKLKIATLGAWIHNVSGNVKHTVKPTDLVGQWVDGRVMSESQYHEYLREKIRSKKRGREDGKKENNL